MWLWFADKFAGFGTSEAILLRELHQFEGLVLLRSGMGAEDHFVA